MAAIEAATVDAYTCSTDMLRPACRWLTRAASISFSRIMTLSSDSTEDSVMDELLSENVVPMELVCDTVLLLKVLVLL